MYLSVSTCMCLYLYTCRTEYISIYIYINMYMHIHIDISQYEDLFSKKRYTPFPKARLQCQCQFSRLCFGKDLLIYTYNSIYIYI